MIDIVRGLHELLPIEEGPGRQQFDCVPVVGDQMTMERGVEAQFSVRNAYTKSRRSEGLEGIYQMSLGFLDVFTT